jgi:hypothetical protein
MLLLCSSLYYHVIQSYTTLFSVILSVRFTICNTHDLPLFASFNIPITKIIAWTIAAAFAADSRKPTKLQYDPRLYTFSFNRTLVDSLVQ